MDAADALKQEREFFDAHRAELLKDHKGKFVLIKDSQLVGTFDTGASVSAVDAAVVRQLGIPPIGTINVGTAGGVQQQAQYPASFSFPGTGLPTINFNFVIGSNLTGQQPPIIALIGRDVLRHFVMIYNGDFGQVVLTI